MKKIFFIVVFASIVLSACKKSGSFLDDKTSSALSEATVFSDSTRTMGFLARIYGDVPFSFYKQRWENGSTENGTDDCEFDLQNPARRPVILYSATWSADNFAFFDFWGTPFTNIRRVNLLLSKLPTAPLTPTTRTRVAAEARFLRAWFYYKLLVNFGGVPIVGDKVYSITDDVNLPRKTFAETVIYIVSELDAAAKDLPLPGQANLPGQYTDVDYGHATKGAAMALKSRVLLYAASPLFNGGAFPAPATPDQVALASYPAYDVAHWQAAASAANDVINSGYYNLYKDNTTAPGYGFYQVFLKRVNPEYIFSFNRPPNRDFENQYNPKSRGGSGRSAPTQNLVDCFPMKNGKAITDPTSGYDPNNPYVGRDPRFGYSIIYNGSLYYLPSAGGKAPVFTYVGSPAGDGMPAIVTSNVIGVSGYYSRKMCDENISSNSSGNTERGWPLIRYAEMLLNYAEAINETGHPELAYDKLKTLRDRAGVDPGLDGLYGMKANMTVDEMRKFVQNERHIELMFEDHRWDDSRRWKISAITQNGYNKLMSITKNGSTYTYTIVNSSRLHAFFPNDYIMPIPTSELRKAPALIQNPGWQ